ncbi:tRNA 5-hydroxyuridine modification protein YegQ [Zhongshania sp.]|uniref:prephenate-dependent tRNA uridine(34) hydroxylase TrhP n=1 Tax=Zhongshania sp. TaxID=1971902 RepID=UPI00356690DB
MIPELLSPAGSLRNMRYAFAYGADAVYAGQPRYSLRVRNNEFKDLDTLRAGMEEAHGQGKKFYLASNISPHNDKIRSYLRDLEPVIEMGPDALIMADPGLMMLVREKWPEQVIHLSVQANAVNWAAVKFWHQNGIQRVILSRELALDEIEEIRQRVPEMEIEVFVHGALCIAYSGRCLLSGYMNHRDPNQGACTNACRWKYQAHEAKEDETGDIVAVNKPAPVQTYVPEPQPAIVTEPVLLQQAQRPGEFMPAYEDEHGTYIMNSKDLRAVQHVERLAAMGVHSLKIEGRTKSHYYVARTAQVYRRAIDDAAHGKPFDMQLMDELDTLANRGYTEGFYRRHPPKEYQNYEMGLNNAQQQQFVGEVVDARDSVITVDVKNRFVTGDTLELMLPGGNTRFQLKTLSDKHGKVINAAPGSGHRVQIPLDQSLPEAALKYGLLVKDINA